MENLTFDNNQEEEGMEVESNFDTRTCIKVKFFTQGSRIYGILTIVFGENMTYIEEAGVHLSSYSMAYNQISNNSSFADFYKTVSDLTDTLSSHGKTYFTLKNVIEKDLTFLEKLSKNKNKPIDIMELEADLKELIRKAISDKKIVIFVAVEIVPSELYFRLQSEIASEIEKSSKENLENEEEEDAEEEEEEEDFFAIDSTSTIVDCSPVVAPVGGIPVAGIEEGDVIFISVGVRPKDQKHINRTERRRSGFIKATVQRAAFEEGLHKILVQINEKTFGKIEESESIKIKVAKKINDFSTEKTEILSNKFLIYLLLFIIVLLITSTYVLLFTIN